VTTFSPAAEIGWSLVRMAATSQATAKQTNIANDQSAG
jgi:hypothetical protein